MSKKVQKFCYAGQRYKQGVSPLEMVAFSAPARDIKKWGGVPHKTDRFHGGFQRALGDRYKGIQRFFDDGQASPTSVVVAFREGALKVSELPYPGNWIASSKLSSEPDYVLVEFEVEDVDVDAADLNDLRKSVQAMLEGRLKKSTLPEGSEDPDSAEDEADVSGAANGEASQDPAGEEELDVGHSKLRSFYDFISDDAKVTSWLKAGEKQLNGTDKKETAGMTDSDSLVATPEQNLKYLLASLLRPAMIVDGQHRVWGAYNSKQSASINFTVNAVKDADWVEQVFQFVVLNKLAKPISPGFLTSILNTSLTNSEVKEIEGRLEKIGIRNTDRRIMKYLNHNEKSPFFNLIAEPGEVAGVDNIGRLSDKGMIRLAKRWMNIKGPEKKKEIEMFLPCLSAKNITEGRERWASYDVWTEYFFAFWQTLKEKYQKAGVWEKKEGFHLLYIVTMHVLQDLFLEKKSEADVKFSSKADFVDQVRKFFEDVNPTFFTGWEATSLQSGERPTWIREAVLDLRAGKTLATIRGSSSLYVKDNKAKKPPAKKKVAATKKGES